MILITCVNELKLLIDQMSNSQAHSFILNIFLYSEYIINIKRSMHVWRKVEVCTRFWWGSLRERDHWGDQDVDVRILLR